MPLDSPIGGAFEGFTRGFIRAREEVQQRQIRAGGALLDAAKSDPTLFDDPQTAKAITAYVGGKEPFELLRTFHQSQSPNKRSFEQRLALGDVSPDEQQAVQSGQQAQSAAIAQNAPRADSGFRNVARGMLGMIPGAAGLVPSAPQPPRVPVPDPYAGSQQKLVAAASNRPGTKVTLDARGGTALAISGPTRSEAGELDVTNKYSSLIDAGWEPMDAASAVGQWAAKNKVKLPSDLRKAFMLKTNAAVEEEMAGAKQRAELKYTGAIASERARGGEIGGARGKAEAARTQVPYKLPSGETISIPLTQVPGFEERTAPLGQAVTGVQGAVDLGRNPSESQRSQLALEGYRIVTDSSGNLIGIPPTAAAGGVPAADVALGPEGVKSRDAVVSQINRWGSDNEFLKAFPSEKELTRLGARSIGKVKAYTRWATDSPKVSRLRAEVQQFGFRAARMLGSNSQLSDSERKAAQAVWQPVIDGNATREQVQEALTSTKQMLGVSGPQPMKATQPSPQQQSDDIMKQYGF